MAALSSDMTEGSYAEDAISTIRRVRLELDALDALGWPDDPVVAR